MENANEAKLFTIVNSLPTGDKPTMSQQEKIFDEPVKNLNENFSGIKNENESETFSNENIKSKPSSIQSPLIITPQTTPSGSLPVNNAKNVDIIKERLNAKSTNSNLRKPERDEFLRNSLRAQGLASKKKFDQEEVKERALIEALRDQTSSSPKSVQNINSINASRNRNILNSATTKEPAVKPFGSKPIGAVAALAYSGRVRRDHELNIRKHIYKPASKEQTVEISESSPEESPKQNKRISLVQETTSPVVPSKHKLSNFSNFNCCKKFSKHPEEKRLMDKELSFDNFNSEQSPTVAVISSSNLKSELGNQLMSEKPIQKDMENRSLLLSSDVNGSNLSLISKNSRTSSLSAPDSDRFSPIIGDSGFCKEVFNAINDQFGEISIEDDARPSEMLGAASNVRSVSPISGEEQDMVPLPDSNAGSESQFERDEKIKVSKFVELFDKNVPTCSKNSYVKPVIKNSYSLLSNDSQRSKSAEKKNDLNFDLEKNLDKISYVEKSLQEPKGKGSSKSLIPLVHAMKDSHQSRFLSQKKYISIPNEELDLKSREESSNLSSRNGKNVLSDQEFLEDASIDSGYFENAQIDSKPIQSYHPVSKIPKHVTFNPSTLQNTTSNFEGKTSKLPIQKGCQNSNLSCKTALSSLSYPKANTTRKMVFEIDANSAKKVLPKVDSITADNYNLEKELSLVSLINVSNNDNRALITEPTTQDENQDTEEKQEPISVNELVKTFDNSLNSASSQKSSRISTVKSIKKLNNLLLSKFET